MKNTVVFQLHAALAEAVAVEWTDHPAPAASGAGWEPCERLGAGRWRMASSDPAAPVHLRGPGLFAGIAIRYRLSPAGAWSPISAERKEIVLVEDGEGGDTGGGTGGGDTGGGTPLPVLPALVVAPSLAGTGKIGAPVSVDPGLWTGAPELALQWCRDAAEIGGATEAAYVPVSEDDRAALTCRITASNAAGSETAVTAALAVTHVAPVVTGELFDEVLDEGTGPQTVEAAGVFEGLALVFAAEGAGAAIDPATGLLTIPTDAPISGETVTVTATNSGGSASAAFLVTVEALPEEVEEPAAGLADEEWALENSTDPTRGDLPTFTVYFPAEPQDRLTSPAYGAVAAEWSDGGPWHPMVPLGPRRHRADSPTPQGTLHKLEFDAWRDDIAIRYLAEAGGEWSGPSATTKSIRGPKAPNAPAPEPAPPPQPAGWLAPSAVPAMGSAGLSQASGTSSVSFTNANGSGSNGGHRIHAFPILMFQAYRGNTANDAKLMSQMKTWLTSGACPHCRSAFTSQHEASAMVCFLVARQVPRLWSQFSSAEKDKIDLLFRAQLVANAFVVSSKHPWSGGQSRGINGQKAWPGGNPNFQVGQVGLVWLSAVWMGLSQAETFLDTFSFGTIRNQLGAANLGNAKTAWDGPYKSNAGGAFPAPPTPKMVEDACRNFRYNVNNYRITQLAAWVDFFFRSRVFNKITHAGLNNENGVMVNGDARGVIFAGKAGLPNRGKRGMAHEFDTTDAGGVRSAIGYSMWGSNGFSHILGALLISGAVRRQDLGSDTRDQIHVGWVDLQYKNIHGYKSHSKGGSGGNNENWFGSQKNSEQRIDTSMSYYFDVLRVLIGK
jgi:hypothetical protein